MTKLHYIASGSFLAGCAIACALTLAVLAAREPERANQHKARVVDDGSVNLPPSSESEVELRQLRAEVQNKNAMLQTLAAVVSAVPRDEPSNGAPSHESPGALDPIAQACDVLDERLLTAPVDGRSSAEMARALQTMLASSAAGMQKVKVASQHCGATMCKLVLRAANPADVEESMRLLSDQTPKLFSRSVVLPSATNEKSMYLARDGESLATDPPEKNDGKSVRKEIVREEAGQKDSLQVVQNQPGQ
jgi:hypothetical protein